MAFTFDSIFAVDPNNPANVARNATITIFDPADPAQAPIAIKDPTGSPLPNPITVDAAGMGPAFQHPTLARVGWKGANFTNYFTSYEGMLNETIAAKDAAQEAAVNAATQAASVIETRIASGEFKGEKGADGANVLPTDTAIRDAINNATSATRGALDTTIAAATAGKAGIADVNNAKASRVFRLACIGNSLYDGTSSSDTNVYDTNPETIYTDSTWYNQTIVLSMGKVVRGGNFGIGGNTTAQVAARINDVINASPRPNACVIGELTNTIGGGADDAGTLAAVDVLFGAADQLAAAGIIPIIMNCPPRGNAAVPKTDDERRRVALANAKMARVASLRGYPLIDVHRVTTDPATGKFLEAATFDGVHYTALYNRKVAEAALEVILPMAGGYSPFLANWNADPTNLITNGLFLGANGVTNGYPMPTGWTGGINNQRAVTAPAAGDKILGNWFDLWKDATVGASTATDYTQQSPSITAASGAFAVGDRMRFACRARIEDVENTVASTGSVHFASISILLGGINRNIGPLYQYTVNIADGLAVIEFTVPTGTTTMAVFLGLAGRGKLRVAQVTLRNLTKLGAL